MINEPTLNELAQMPKISDVTRKQYKYRWVHMHFFNDEEEFFASGFDTVTQTICGYGVRLDRHGRVYGTWDKEPFSDYLAKRSKFTGAELVRNTHFQKSLPYEVPKILICQERWSKFDKSQDDAIGDGMF